LSLFVEPQSVSFFQIRFRSMQKTSLVAGISVRLRRMHEMQTIFTDDCGVCLSVGLSVTRLNSASLCKNDSTGQDAVWGEHS